MGEQETTIRTLEDFLPSRRFSFEEVYDRMDEVYDSIARRAFELFESNGRTPGHDLEDWFRAEAELLHPVHIEVSESDEVLAVSAEVPGFTAEELEVSVEPRRLTITGRRKTKEERKEGKTILSERCADQILRVIDLPIEIQTGKVAATLRYGVLELSMPKAAPTKKVDVKLKETQEATSAATPKNASEGTMSVSRRIHDYLDSQNVKYEWLPHSQAFTAQEVAQSLHVSGKHFAKAIVLHSNGRLVMAVVPASHRLNLHELQRAAGVKHLELASENVLAEVCSGCELGAFPPFGNLYGMDVWVDRALTESEEMLFNAGTHTAAVRMKYSDYENIVKPRIAKFAEVSMS